MTDEMMSLRTLLEKSSDAICCARCGFCAQRLDGARSRKLTGRARRAQPGPQSITAMATVSGLETPLGRVELRIPKLRKSSYFPLFLDAAPGREALAAVVQEAYVHACRRARLMIWSKQWA